MSKRLPFYQSEPAEYLAGDIMFCSYAAQGVFSILRALYWQKDCNLTLSQAKRRCKGADNLIKELIDEEIIKINNDDIIINFLDEQFEKATSKSIVNSENGKKGARARWNKKRKDSDAIATPLKTDSEHIALREDKIIKDEIREDKMIEDENTYHNIGILKSYYLTKTQIVEAVINNKKNNVKDLEDLKIKLDLYCKELTELGRLSETWLEFTSYFRNSLKIGKFDAKPDKPKTSKEHKPKIAF